MHDHNLPEHLAALIDTAYIIIHHGKPQPAPESKAAHMMKAEHDIREACVRTVATLSKRSANIEAAAMHWYRDWTTQGIEAPSLTCGFDPSTINLFKVCEHASQRH